MAKRAKKKASQKRNERIETLIRILVAVVSGIILGIWRYLILALALVNLVITLVTGRRHREIAEFSEYWNTEYYKYFRYLTFVSNKRPFPFSSLERISKFNGNHHKNV